jgi:ATPase subunit of ABC transporter with duplicated ATPase domains
VVGAAAPDAGNVQLGASVKLGYFAQHAMELIQGDKSVLETVSEQHPRASVASLLTLLGAFGFSGDDADKRCRVLSGGEKARCSTSPPTTSTSTPRRC